jgi:predicted nuclease with TOPRIM domain
MQEYVNKYKKPALYVLIGLVVIYGMIYIFTPKPQMPTEYKNTLDSLAKENATLRDKQKQADSAISSYQSQIFDLYYAISNVKEKETVIKEYYHEVSDKVNNYTPTQVDSFFKARYNY